MPTWSDELFRQSPVLTIAVLIAWYYQRHILKQHARELAAKDAEIARLIEEKHREIDRIIRERKQFLELALKELSPLKKMHGRRSEQQEPPVEGEK